MSHFYGYMQIIENLKSEKWEKITPAERMDTLISLEGFTATQEGREPRKIILEDMKDMGSYDPDTGIIHLNSQLVYDKNKNYEAMATLFHEGRHAYQDDAIKNRLSEDYAPDKETLDKWIKNDNVYDEFNAREEFNADDRDESPEYWFQPLEEDAEKFATGRMEQLEDLFRDDPKYKQYLDAEKNCMAQMEKSLIDSRGDNFRDAIQSEIDDLNEKKAKEKSSNRDNVEGETTANTKKRMDKTPDTTNNVKHIDPKEIDMSTARGMDDPNFWNHHGNDKATYMGLAEHLPEIQSQLADGKSIDQIKENPELAASVNAFYNPDNMVKVNKTPDGGYEFEDDGRHRVKAAQEAGYEIPVKVIGEEENMAQDNTDVPENKPEKTEDLEETAKPEMEESKPEETEDLGEEETKGLEEPEVEESKPEESEGLEAEEYKPEETEKIEAEEPKPEKTEEMEAKEPKSEEAENINAEESKPEEAENINAEEIEDSKKEEPEETTGLETKEAELEKPKVKEHGLESNESNLEKNKLEETEKQEKEKTNSEETVRDNNQPESDRNNVEKIDQNNQNSNQEQPEQNNQTEQPEQNKQNNQSEQPEQSKQNGQSEQPEQSKQNNQTEQPEQSKSNTQPEKPEQNKDNDNGYDYYSGYGY